jgi:hypothetical protein
MAHQLESGDGAAGVLASSFDIFPEAKATVGGLHLLRADRRSFFDYIAAHESGNGTRSSHGCHRAHREALIEHRTLDGCEIDLIIRTFMKR